MKKIKKYTLIALILLFVSFNLLSLATIFYSFETNIEDYKYSDNEEYNNINEGLSIINSLPIQINISNKYFSNFDNLPEETRQSIILAYTIKNNIATYKCGTKETSICIDKKQVEKSTALDIFNSQTKLVANNIKLYIDNYGNYTINSSNTSTYYKVNLDDYNENENYKKYTKFYKYKEENDLYIFYVYEGYYKSNCLTGESIILHDFITGKEVYKGICDNNSFLEEPNEELKKLQLYKYELKKDDNNKLYLYGYNPVKNK